MLAKWVKNSAFQSDLPITMVGSIHYVQFHKPSSESDQEEVIGDDTTGNLE